jgi:hydrophobe/amphiphile efflux-1 (HAE1) family protein
MISNFFLKRPVFATVLSIFILLTGLAAMRVLPLEQYPDITPPQILVTARFPGASAQAMADSVAAPLEQAINGVDNMIYMFSQNTTPGIMNLSVYFSIGTDPNEALTQTQNRVNLALASLPEEVRAQGVSVSKRFPSILLFIALESPEGLRDDIFVGNYASIYIADELDRIKGVSVARVLNARDYSMRIWLQPDRMAQFGLSASEVIQAIRAQNSVRSIGQIGQEPTASPIELTIPVGSRGRLSDPKEFESIILRSGADGSAIRVKDIGRVELGAASYDIAGMLNGKSGAYIGIYQETGANAIEVANSVKAKMQELSRSFPSGITYSIPYDTTEYIKLSIREVIKTLIEAAILVSLVIYLFLHSFRATLIPVLAMIVSIIGTFTGMYFLGFSINTLTLFGMVLAVGIVVDDAIIVVENVERNMREKQLPPWDAAILAMKEVSGPVIAIVFVLCAVFIPVAFIGGIPGQFYRQFAITISVSVVISGFVALTLSPVLSAMLLKPNQKEGKFGSAFNRFFERFSNGYLSIARWVASKPRMAFGSCMILLGAVVLLAIAIPLGFIPEEDQGLLFVVSKLPDGASLSRVEKVSEAIEQIAEKTPGVQDVLSFSGFSLVESIARTRMGTNFIRLENWSDRTSKELHAKAIAESLYHEFSSLPEAEIAIFNPPLIPGVGFVGGFDFWVVNHGGASMNELDAAVHAIIEKAQKHPEFKKFITSVQANCMELYLDLDISKARALGVKIEDVYETLQVLLGSRFINHFNKFGRVFQVVAQAEPSFRDDISDIGDVFVRSASGTMVPLKSIVTPRFASAPTLVSRFNGSPAALISIVPAVISANKIMSIMEETAKETLPPTMSFSWGGLAYQQKISSDVPGVSLLGALVMVFLVLAALYERWSLPLTILFSIPFAIFGAMLAVWLRGMANDIFFQIGIVTLIGLTAKNAILIVEFAQEKRKEGMSIAEAAFEAARLRFRAILMTSLTFIFGIFPLTITQGAGAASRQSVGTGVVGGMIAATVLAVFFVPYFYLRMEERVERRKRKKE